MNLRSLATRLVALAAVPAALVGLAAAPAAADPSSIQSNCVGKQSIWGDSWQIYGSAGTVCDGSADFLRVSVFIRHQDKLGFVSTCGISSTATGNWTTTVTASASSCLSSGVGDTYWIYSEHYASINGQVFDFTAGGWDTPT